MKVAIYSPYLDTLGGGEKYMMTIAEAFSLQDTVDILIDKHLENIGKDYLKQELSSRFDLNLNKVNFISAPVGKNSSPFSRVFFLKKYDLLFYLTDGSIFFPTAKKNILHIQSPLKGQAKKSLWGKFKLKGWGLIIYNSGFTKEFAKNNWPIESLVIYPPVDIDKIKPLKKKKIILSVGRFFGFLKDKKHEILITAFKDIYKSGQLKDWSLNLVGSASEGDSSYVEYLNNLAKGLPINILPNLEHDKLVKLYGESSIYWHAAGFEETDPTKMEHFGISTVEAMAGGCVPVVVKKGGQIEIVENKISGYLWDYLQELKELTINLIQNDDLMNKTSKQAVKRSTVFSKEKFINKIINLASASS